MTDNFVINGGVMVSYSGPEKEIEVPEGVHIIGEGAFKGMAHLLKVTFPSSLVKIEGFAFKGCRQLREINIPEGLTEIGEYAFHRCHGLEELSFPSSMTKVGNYAFLYCDSLRKVSLEGPERLGTAAFSHNLALKEIALNANVDTSNFSEEVFEGCAHINKISLSGKIYDVPNLIEAMDSHAAYPQVIKAIAKSVYHSMQIDDGELKKFSINLKKITLPEGITKLGKGSFFDKKGIVSITCPESLRGISENAFLNCLSLEEIIFPNAEVELCDKAFRGCCNLKKVTVCDKEYILEDEVTDRLVGKIKDQVLGDFYLSGRILVRYMGKEEQITIPKGVEIIGERCFFGKEQLKTVLCPDGLREIREQAFAGCLTLQNIVLPETVKRVEREAFSDCRKLLKCNIPEKCEYIGEYAFRRCFALRPFEPWPSGAEIHPFAFYLARNFDQPENEVRIYEEAIPADIDAYSNSENDDIKILKLSGIKRIGKYAYSSCPNLKEVIIDAPDLVIERNAFSTCPRLKKVTLCVKEIGKAAFAYCRNLEEVKISGVTELSAECFTGCYALRDIEAAGAKEIGSRCFDECVSLEAFDLDKIETVGERSFERCDALKSVKLGKTLCLYHSFADCASLESVEITGETKLGSGVFAGSTQIKEIICESGKYEFSKFTDSLNLTDNPYPAGIREVIASVYSCFEISESKAITGYLQDATSVTIPEDIEEIGPDVFRDKNRLKSVKFPPSVKLIGSHAFSMTAWLDDERNKSDMVIVGSILLDGAMCKGRVQLPSEINRVASWCFAGNIDITHLVIPTDRIGIENLAFRNCLNLKRITDAAGNTYELKNVSDLTDGRYPELIQRIFSECINCFKLDEERNLIESTGNIKNLTFPEGIKSVGDSVYLDCHLLETIVLSSDTESIGKSSFENSKWLRSVSNAENVRIIGAQAFSGCQSLEEIDLSDNLLSIGIRAFEHCCNLKEIHLSNKLEKIPERAFFRCKSLKKVVIPESVKVIEAEAFAFCSELTEVIIPGTTKVSDRAFAYCDKL